MYFSQFWHTSKLFFRAGMLWTGDGQAIFCGCFLIQLTGCFVACGRLMHVAICHKQLLTTVCLLVSNLVTDVSDCQMFFFICLLVSICWAKLYMWSVLLVKSKRAYGSCGTWKQWYICCSCRDLYGSEQKFRGIVFDSCCLSLAAHGCFACCLGNEKGSWERRHAKPIT